VHVAPLPPFFAFDMFTTGTNTPLRAAEHFAARVDDGSRRNHLKSPPTYVNEFKWKLEFFTIDVKSFEACRFDL